MRPCASPAWTNRPIGRQGAETEIRAPKSLHDLLKHVRSVSIGCIIITVLLSACRTMCKTSLSFGRHPRERVQKKRGGQLGIGVCATAKDTLKSGVRSAQGGAYDDRAQ